MNPSQQRTSTGKFAKVRMHYEVTVWNTSNGDIEKYMSDATEDELQSCIDYYWDEPMYEVLIDDQWEVIENDE